MKDKKEARKKASKAGPIIGIVVVIAIIVAIFFILRGGKNSVPQASIDQFAQCLTSSGATMYGAFWCPHCAATKKMFGSSFRYIKYVECDPNGPEQQAELCIEKGIDRYDTWEFADGSRIISEPTFAQLAEKSGCPAPEGAK
jgi:glutaredoxin